MKIVSQWIINGEIQFDPISRDRYHASKRILILCNYKDARIYFIGNEIISEKTALRLIDEAIPEAFVHFD